MTELLFIQEHVVSYLFIVCSYLPAEKKRYFQETLKNNLIKGSIMSNN